MAGPERNVLLLKDFGDFEKIVTDAFAKYWWLGERASSQLAAAALCALNQAGVIYWPASPKAAPPEPPTPSEKTHVG